jgi:hypothetical protein
MNPKPKTPFQKFQALAKGIVRVPKSEVDMKKKSERARSKHRHVSK